ncbi:MAG TPA: hypothetical protein VNK04_23945 [Gemmataceae bacterium]|nr:hypothetical protein [Gemmataceae bacterium]
MRYLSWKTGAAAFAGALLFTMVTAAQDAAPKQEAKKKGKAAAPAEPTYPPSLPGGKAVATDRSDDFLKPTAPLREGVTIARTPPTVDFLYYPGQTYPGRPWSNWGDSLAANGKYYASIGDHLAPAGNAFVYEYDPETKKFRLLADVRKILNLPEGHYTPGKIHGRIDLGDDGWLYFSTHRGSPRVTTDQYHYKGDWILRAHPQTGKAEVVVQGPVPKHCIPNSVLDPKRLIFYGGTAAGTGSEDEGIQFFAYDVKNRKLLYSGPDGPSRYMIFARSTGRVYYTPRNELSPLMRYDPEKGGSPERVEGQIGIRAATQETPQGIVYTVSQGQGGREATLYSFNVKTEAIKVLGPAPVGKQTYIATLDADPTGRYIYYMPGAHGGSETDGTPVVQFDVKTRQKKVIAFLHPFYQNKYGCTLKGTYSAAVDPKGDKLYITWNASRGGRAWDSCALTVIHIPESERQP